MMAKEQHISADDDFFLGTDYALECHIKDRLEAASINISGWALSWKLHKQKTAAATLTKTTSAGIAIAGTYNSVPATNTQRATVTIVDTDTDAVAPGVYYHELKRTDDGFETVLLFGSAVLKRAGHTS